MSTGTWGAVGSGAQFTSELLAGSGWLQVSSVESSLPGDFDGNGLVDDADLAKWLVDFGTTDASDADGDGDSDGRDFLLWQSNYLPGTASPVTASVVTAAVGTASLRIGAALQAIPEPSSMLLILFGILKLTCVRLR